MLAYEEKVTTNQAAFLAKVVQVAAALGLPADFLMVVMYYESRLNPKAQNPYTRATGLIQFMPSTAASLGTSTAALLAMSNVQQLDYVEKYYRKIGAVGKVKDAVDLYLFTFYPAAAGKADNHVIFAKGSTGYTQNTVLDRNGDGLITVGDIRTIINGYTPAFVLAAQKKSPDVMASAWPIAVFGALFLLGKKKKS